MNREQRREWRRDIKRRKRKGTGMLAREKWQVKTIAVLEEVFEERKRQIEKHGEAMRELPDGTGPFVEWLQPISEDHAYVIQERLREDYEQHRGAENPDGQYGQLTRMHLIREELAEAFELDGDDPRFVYEILQVAALCVQWAEYKIPDRTESYRGYILHHWGDNVKVYSAQGDFIEDAPSRDRAVSNINDWMVAP